MECRIEDRRLVGRPRSRSLGSVETGMAELEIDREDVHDRKKSRSVVENGRVCIPETGEHLHYY